MPSSSPTPGELMVAAVESALPGRTQRRSIAVNFPDGMYDVVMEAARARGISSTAYMRRAATAFAAQDLGLDWHELMLDEKGVQQYGIKGGGAALPPARGEGFGPWVITGLRQ